MIAGRIQSLDVAHRQAVIRTEEAQEVTVTFPEGAIIEVAEPETMGTKGGELADLREGFYVEVEVATHDSASSCTCAALVCVS
jgi:hypothetical protein